MSSDARDGLAGGPLPGGTRLRDGQPGPHQGQDQTICTERSLAPGGNQLGCSWRRGLTGRGSSGEDSRDKGWRARCTDGTVVA